MALSFDINANTRAAQKQTSDLGKSLQDVSDELDALGRDKSTAKLEANLRDLAAEAEDTGKKIKKGISTGLKETADEAKQSGKEAAASCSGEFSDVGGFLQETVAQGLGGFGPLGLAAGLAGAAGIGVVMSEIEKQQEAAKALGEFFAGAYQKAAEEGRKYIDAATIIGEAQDIIFNPDRQAEYNQAQADGLKIGLDANTLIRARAGDQDALNTVLAATAERQADIKAKAEEGGSTAIRLAQGERGEVEKIQGAYEDIGRLHETNAANMKRAQEIADGLHTEERTQIQRTKDASQARWDAEAAARAAASQPIVVPLRVDDSDAYQRIANLRAAAARAVNINVIVNGRAVV